MGISFWRRVENGLHLISMIVLASIVAACDRAGFDPDPHLATRDQYSVTIHRDLRGVPHVYGKTDADAAFGLAYAQGEDHWALIEAQMPFYRGTNARFNGPDAAVTDYLIKLLKIWPTIEQKYETDLDEATRSYIRGFVAGLNYYAATHPDALEYPEILPVTEHDIVAGNMLRHLLFYGFEGSIRELTGPRRVREVSARNQAPSESADAGELRIGYVPIGSNAFAVMPHATDDGATRLAINSHQPTTGPVAWYEAHVHSESGLNVMGGLFPGSATISLGFNEQVAWAATVNQPDLVDVFVLEINPEDESSYQLDGRWQPLETGSVEIDVLLWGWLPWSVSQDVAYSAHGPVLRTDHGTYAIRYAGHGEIRQAQQWYRLGKSADLDGWLDVMRMGSFASFNFVVADVLGHIAFLHNSLTPLRQAGYDWNLYLPGDDSSLIWDQYLPMDQLPLIVNPQAGYVHSANQTPFQVTAPEENPSPLNFPTEAGFQTGMTNRAYRGLELFDALVPISAQDFFAIKHDKYYSTKSKPAGWVAQVVAENFDGEAQLKAAQRILSDWDLGTDVNNRAAALGVCFVATDWQENLDVLPAAELRTALRDCVDRLQQHYGRLDPSWGEVNRHVRGTVNVAVGGGPDILRAIYGRGLAEDGFLTNVAGDGLYYLVSWDADGQQMVQGTHHFGSATLDATSDHYSDQAADYAGEILHDPLFDEGRLMSNLLKSYEP